LKDNNDSGDEEAKYGAVDRRNEKVVYGKKARVTCTKFKAFHSKVGNNAL